MSSSAHTVAVATPCCPAPVSAMIRRLPIRRASSAWPSALLSLCEPVWLRSSRLRYTGRPQRSDSRRGEVQRRGPPAEVAQQPVQLGPVAGVLAGLPPRLLQLRQRGHQRLGDVLPPVGPKRCPKRLLESRSRAARVSRRSPPRQRTRAAARGPCAPEPPRAGGGIQREWSCVCAVRAGRKDRLCRRSRAQATAEDQRHLGAPRGEQAPVERLPRTAAQLLPAGYGRARVEQVEVGVKALHVADLPNRGHLHRLDHPRPRAVARLRAICRPLVAVQLQHRQPQLITGLHHLTRGGR